MTHSIRFIHRYGLAFPEPDNRAQLVEAGNRARLAEELLGRTQTEKYRLLHACEMLLAGRETLAGLADVVKEVRAK